MRFRLLELDFINNCFYKKIWILVTFCFRSAACIPSRQTEYPNMAKLWCRPHKTAQPDSYYLNDLATF